VTPQGITLQPLHRFPTCAHHRKAWFFWFLYPRSKNWFGRGSLWMGSGGPRCLHLPLREVTHASEAPERTAQQQSSPRSNSNKRCSPS